MAVHLSASAVALAPPPSSATSSPFPRTPASVPHNPAPHPRLPARSPHPSDKIAALRRCRSFSFPVPASAPPSRAGSRCCAAHGSAEGGPGEAGVEIQRAEGGVTPRAEGEAGTGTQGAEGAPGVRTQGAEGEQQGEERRPPSGEEDRPAEAADLYLSRDRGVVRMPEVGAYVGNAAREGGAAENSLPRERGVLGMPDGGAHMGNTAREGLNTRLACTGKSVLQAVCSAVLSGSLHCSFCRLSNFPSLPGRWGFPVRVTSGRLYSFVCARKGGGSSRVSFTGAASSRAAGAEVRAMYWGGGGEQVGVSRGEGRDVGGGKWVNGGPRGREGAGGGGAGGGFPSLEQLLAEQLVQRYVPCSGGWAGEEEHVRGSRWRTATAAPARTSSFNPSVSFTGAARSSAGAAGAEVCALFRVMSDGELVGFFQQLLTAARHTGVEGGQQQNGQQQQLGGQQGQQGAAAGFPQGKQQESADSDGLPSSGNPVFGLQFFSAVQGQMEWFQGQVERLQQQIERFQQQDTPLGIKAGKVVAAAAAVGFTAAAGVVALRVPDGWEEEMGDGSWKREKEVVEKGGSWMVGSGSAGKGDEVEGSEGRDGREEKEDKDEKLLLQQKQEGEQRQEQRKEKEKDQEEQDKGQEQERRGEGGRERGGAVRGAEVGVIVDTEESGVTGGRRKGVRGELEGSEGGGERWRGVRRRRWVGLLGGDEEDEEGGWEERGVARGYDDNLSEGEEEGPVRRVVAGAAAGAGSAAVAADDSASAAADAASAGSGSDIALALPPSGSEASSAVAGSWSDLVVPKRSHKGMGEGERSAPAHMYNGGDEKGESEGEGTGEGEGVGRGVGEGEAKGEEGKREERKGEVRDTAQLREAGESAVAVNRAVSREEAVADSRAVSGERTPAEGWAEVGERAVVKDRVEAGERTVAEGRDVAGERAVAGGIAATGRKVPDSAMDTSMDRVFRRNGRWEVEASGGGRSGRLDAGGDAGEAEPGEGMEGYGWERGRRGREARWKVGGEMREVREGDLTNWEVEDGWREKGRRGERGDLRDWEGKVAEEKRSGGGFHGSDIAGSKRVALSKKKGVQEEGPPTRRREFVVARKISRRLITDQPAKTMSAVTMQTAAAVKPSAFVGSTSLSLKASQHKRLQMAAPSRASAAVVRCSAVRSERLWTPNSAANSGDIWSIKNDLEVPQSLFMGAPEVMAGQGAPPPMLQERFQSVISQLFQNRIIRCGGAVDDDMANLIVAQLLYLDAVDPTKDIIMYVNSPGGSVTAGMAIFDTMRHIRPDVSTVCVGLAASMGAFLLSAGTKGKRYSLPNSRIMIHQPLGGAQGQQTDIEIQANEILHHKANLNGYLAYHTGQSYDQIVQDTDRDFFMSATEAKEYGLIDAVITNPLKALNAAPVAA
ncbi:unnamed protein product [Closterium sp. Naga37s-1]|nr:unnamed protein product [Closterium sp. Naga37s-1]